MTGEQEGNAKERNTGTQPEGAPGTPVGIVSETARPPGGPETRRSFLAAGAGLLTGLITAVLGIPMAITAIARSSRKKAGQFSKAGELASLPQGKPVNLKYMAMTEEAFVMAEEMRDVWAIRTSASEVTVFSPVCPHLGCRYHWDEASGQFMCPCHGSVFAKDGKVLSGPSPRPLDALPVKIENGAILVEWELFQVGTAEKTIMER